MQKKIEAFNKNGYWIEKDFFSFKELKEMFLLFYDISLSMHKKFLSRSSKFKELNEIKYDKSGIKTLDKILMEIFRKDKKLIGEIYDTVSYTSTFLRFLSNEKIEKLTRKLLELPNNSSLYGFTKE